MKRARSKKQSAQNKLRRQEAPAKLPFIEHIYELRKRLFTVAISVIGFSVAAYFIQQHITNALLAPAQDQQFIYTSPGGGIDFLFRVCLYTGILCSIPVIVHQLLRYLQPLIKQDGLRFVHQASIASGVLALAGMLFGYFVGLPAAMHFLLHQFTNDKIEALLSIQSYMSFVMIYLLGAAMLFQLPLILLLINRIKPLPPKKLLKAERWVILGAIIAGGIISPTPSIIDQMMLAGPIILTYQVGIALVWYVNRKPRRPKHVAELLQKDAEARAARLEQFQSAHATWRQAAANVTPKAAVAPATTAIKPVSAQPKPVVPVATQPVSPRALPNRPADRRRYLDGFNRRPYFAPTTGTD